MDIVLAFFLSCLSTRQTKIGRGSCLGRSTWRLFFSFLSCLFFSLALTRIGMRVNDRKLCKIYVMFLFLFHALLVPLILFRFPIISRPSHDKDVATRRDPCRALERLGMIPVSQYFNLDIHFIVHLWASPPGTQALRGLSRVQCVQCRLSNKRIQFHRHMYPVHVHTARHLTRLCSPPSSITFIYPVPSSPFFYPSSLLFIITQYDDQTCRIFNRRRRH